MMPFHRGSHEATEIPGEVLEIQDLTAGYGSAMILHRVNMRVTPGEIVALLGRNGAGKTTLLRCISGLIPARHGSIRLGAQEVSRWAPTKRVARGIAHVPQGRRIVAGLCVRENLQIGGYVVRGRGSLDARLEEVLDSFPILRGWLSKQAQNLSGGQQQLLAIARALMSPARVVLLDEPLTGLSPAVASEVMDIVATLRSEGRTVLLVEQNAYMALDIADRFYMLDRGTIVVSEHHAGQKRIEEIERGYLGLKGVEVTE